MQRFTITERLLVVSLLPALALLVRQALGPAEPPVWLLFGAAVSILDAGARRLPRPFDHDRDPSRHRGGERPCGERRARGAQNTA